MWDAVAVLARHLANGIVEWESIRALPPDCIKQMSWGSSNGYY